MHSKISEGGFYVFLGQLGFLVERCNLAFSLTALNIETASLMIAFVVTTQLV